MLGQQVPPVDRLKSAGAAVPPRPAAGIWTRSWPRAAGTGCSSGAVYDESEVRDVLVQKGRNKAAALKLLRRLLSHTGVSPEAIVTDKLASYRAAMKIVGLQERHHPGGMRQSNLGRKLTPRHATKRTKAAEIQIPGLSPTLLRQPRTDL